MPGLSLRSFRCFLLCWTLVPLAGRAQTTPDEAAPAVHRDPPFGGTIFLDPDIITPSDPTTLVDVSYAGQGLRTMYDRRVASWITVNAYLFDTHFDDGLTAEIQVNPEFGNPDAALAEAQTYAPVIGRLPTALRIDLETVWIHKGTEPFGGGNNNLLIHTGQAALYDAEGILEETLVHEAAHTSLDAYHAAAPDWLAAQTTDPDFISTYARDFPDREDVAESFLPYLAVRYRPGRISQQLYDTIVQTIPNRIAYFDGQPFNLYPIAQTGTGAERIGADVPQAFMLLPNYPNPFHPTTTFTFTLPQPSPVRLSVYDLLGREVAVPAAGAFPAGRFQATWDATAFGSGVYVYRLQAGTFSQARELLLLK